MSRSRPIPARTSATAVRCAIYTRKSSEEGLEQEFNSLDAQRESGESYIASQAGEGWICLPDRYDDGAGQACLRHLRSACRVRAGTDLRADQGRPLRGAGKGKARRGAVQDDAG